ncbi:hypothetical protein GIB67_021243 [Kingdonia uniflora]|uniref:Uncharacterized protein n=1 Tax=Kingdonia uniflora TaxID=39325 RepID=A0A7J7LFL5_9MAGN|nr:hypothetical protein GIB67_021243 [Kingdonia uniflora]
MRYHCNLFDIIVNYLWGVGSNFSSARVFHFPPQGNHSCIIYCSCLVNSFDRAYSTYRSY